MPNSGAKRLNEDERWESTVVNGFDDDDDDNNYGTIMTITCNKTGVQHINV
jgi:hypothetical protein